MSNPLADQTTFIAPLAQTPKVPTTSITSTATEQTKKIPALPTIDEGDKPETVRQYIENWIPNFELDNDRSSLLCSSASTPLTLDFANL